MSSNEPESWPFICSYCGQPASGTVTGRAVWSGHDNRGRGVSPPVEWTLLQCSRCHEPTLKIREDFGLGNGFDDDDNPNTLYPAPPSISLSIPKELRDAWEEAHRCFEAKSYPGCAAMVRRTIEATCADQGIQGRTLADQLSTMGSQGLIDGTLQQWADALRLLGNRGAHYVEKVSRQDAEDALHFAEALLDHLYVLRKRFAEFQARLNSP